MCLRDIPDEAISQARDLLCSNTHSSIYIQTGPPTSCLSDVVIRQGMITARDDTRCNLSLFEHKPIFLIAQMCSTRGEGGGEGESCLTSVSASVALSSNSVMVFLTPS